MSAKASLLSSLRVLKDCLGDQALVDRAPTEVAHNLRAAMLRQGLAVLTFSTLESFVRDRAGEILRSFNPAVVSFSSLSPALQKATTVEALEGLRFRLRLQQPADKISWLLANIKSVAHADTDIGNLSPLAFGQNNSNLVQADIANILSAFGVGTPWDQMTGLAARVGLSLPSCVVEFEAIRKRRHAAAHALSTSVLHADLLSSIRAAMAICLTFDLLLSHCKSLHNVGIVPGTGGVPLVSHAQVGLVFVGRHPSKPGYVVQNGQPPPPASPLSRPTIRVLPDEAGAVAHARTYAQPRKRQSVVLDQTSSPKDWYLW